MFLEVLSVTCVNVCVYLWIVYRNLYDPMDIAYKLELALFGRY